MNSCQKALSTCEQPTSHATPLCDQTSHFFCQELEESRPTGMTETLTQPFSNASFVEDILNVIFVVLFYKLVFLFENLLNTTHQNDQADFISCQRWRCEE